MGQHIAKLEKRFRWSWHPRRSQSKFNVNFKRASNASSGSENSKEDLASLLGAVVGPFIRNLGYKSPSRPDDERLWVNAISKAEQMGLPCPKGSTNLKRLKVGYSYAHFCFPCHHNEVKLYVAVYTLFAQCLDDVTTEAISEIDGFYKRFCAREKQPNCVLEGWASLMLEAYDFWPPIVANLINSASLNMITSTMIEHKVIVNSSRLSSGGRNWAYYLRNMDGLGDAFALFTFSGLMYSDASQFIEALPDMAMYIVLANDLLSFYKEQLQGEENNYIHTRAKYESKHVFETLEDVAKETEACYRRIRQVLDAGGEDRKPYAEIWQLHEQGYVDFHRFSGRYMLDEIITDH